MDGCNSCFVLLLMSCTLNTCSGSGNKTFCYFTNWSNAFENLAARFTIADINTTLCSHLIYSFADIDAVGKSLVPSAAGDDTSSSGDKTGRYYDFNRLKNQAPGLVTLIAIGGADAGDSGFQSVVQSQSARGDFAKNVVAFLRKYGFDGLDVDWEWPEQEHRDQFTQLLKTLREEFETESQRETKRRLLLTVAVAVGESTIAASYNIPDMSRYVDYINVMAYDFHGPWSKVTSFSSPLFPRSSTNLFNQKLSQAWAIDHWIQAGAPASKLVLGCTGTATTFNLPNSAVNGVGASVTGPGDPGPYIQQRGRIVHSRVCDLLDEGAQKKWDEEQKMDYLLYGTLWVGYNSRRAIEEKVQYAYRKNLAGIMFWSLEQDDFKGTHCRAGKYPLLTTIHDTLQRLSQTNDTTNDTDDPSGAQTVLGVISTLVMMTMLTALL